MDSGFSVLHPAESKKAWMCWDELQNISTILQEFTIHKCANPERGDRTLGIQERSGLTGESRTMFLTVMVFKKCSGRKEADQIQFQDIAMTQKNIN
jgi:hypothetical protein